MKYIVLGLIVAYAVAVIGVSAMAAIDFKDFLQELKHTIGTLTPMLLTAVGVLVGIGLVVYGLYTIGGGE